MRPQLTRHRAFQITLTLASSLIGNVCVAQTEQRIVCPAALKPEQVRVEASAGWHGIYGPIGVRTLQGAQAIFTETTSLRDSWGELSAPPTVEKNRGASIDVTYPLPDDPELSKWLLCHYGDRLVQARKLPAATKACTVTSHRETDAHTKKPVYRVANITCQ